MKNLRWTGVLLTFSMAGWTLGCPAEEDDPEVTEYQVELVGENQIPAIATPASGTMDVMLDADNVLTIDGEFDGLVSRLMEVEGSVAHLHVGPSEEAGPTVFNVDVDADQDERSGTFTLTEELSADQIMVFENNEYFINIHTRAYPDGELRGQLDPDAPQYESIDESWGVELSAQVQPHAVDTNADGWMWAILRDDDSFVVSGAVQNLSSEITDVVIERAETGEIGPVEITLEFEETNDDTYRFWHAEELNEARRDDLRDGLYYINILTADYPDGELRGQLDEADGFFQNIWEDIFGDDPDIIEEAPPF